MTPQPRRPMAAGDGNLEWRVKVLERDVEGQEDRIGGLLNVQIRQEEQLTGERGVFSELRELRDDVRKTNELIRSDQEERARQRAADQEERARDRRADREERAKRMWQFAGVTGAAVITSFGAIYAAGLAHP